MKTLRIIPVSAAIIALSFSVAQRCEAEVASTFSLILSLADGKSDGLPLLPIVLTIQLRNDGPTSRNITNAGLDVVQVEPPVLPPRYRFTVEMPDGQRHLVHNTNRTDYQEFYVAGFRQTPQVFLAPGEKQVMDYCLSYGAFDFPDSLDYGALVHKAHAVFPAPGDYRVRLSMPRIGMDRRPGPTGVESNWLTVRIMAPTAPADVWACDILRRGARPAMFLTPLADPAADEGNGLPVFDGSTELALESTPSTSPLETCREILRRCPDSAYAPYARLFLSIASSTRRFQGHSGATSKTTSVQEQLENLRLLRQAAEDLRLSRRYREAALVSLKQCASRLEQRAEREALATTPSLESIIGRKKAESITPFPFEVFQLVQKMADDSAPPGGVQFLTSRLTPTDIEALKAAVKANPAIARSPWPDPTQAEATGHVQWAKSQLRNLPWRDPQTDRVKPRAVGPEVR